MKIVTFLQDVDMQAWVYFPAMESAGAKCKTDVNS